MDVLNLAIIETLPFPLCDIKEQRQIVTEIERLLSVINQKEATINVALIQSDALRQSILKKAFSGQLVEQDPNDELASILLERIKAEKEKQVQPGKIKKKKRKAAA